ncbi:MAG: hypothetical protein SGJ05_07315 [bacterium]|nr:hypothetical protein [bacterium]
MAAVETATVAGLITAAAQGAATGIKALRDAKIPVELEQFEIEVKFNAKTSLVTRAASTGALVGPSGNSGDTFDLQFGVGVSALSKSSTQKTSESTSLRVRFVFSGKDEEEPAPTPIGGRTPTPNP